MNTRKFLIFIVMLSALVFTACEGPVGPEGEDGVDGSYPTIDVSGVSVYPKTLELGIGDYSNQLEATVVPEDATNQLVFWESSDDTFVQVDANGVVTTSSLDTVEITATTDAGDFSDSATVIVEAGSVLYYVDSISSSATHDRYLEGLEELDDDGNITLTIASNLSQVEDAIVNDTYDAIVFFRQNSPIDTSTATSLIDWVQKDGRLIFATFSDTNATNLLDELEVSFTADDNQAEITFTTSRTSHNLDEDMQLFTAPWSTYAVGLEAQGSGYSVCDFEDGNSCGVVGNQGRTLTLGFLSDTLPDDTEEQIVLNTLGTIFD